MTVAFKNVVIIGVGLIGGSLGLVLKQRGMAEAVVGAGRRVENLELGVKVGAIDRYETDVNEAVRHADLVVLATPVETYASHLTQWGALLPKGAIVTDAGSVKGRLVEEAERLLPAHVRFVGGHPIAGKEKSGVAFADAALFQGARCLLTPTAHTDSDALESVQAMWEAAGSVVSLLDPHVHDFVLGAVSHLPHVAAFALMQALSELEGRNQDAASLLRYSGGGLRDTTRIAASSPEMWRDICLANRDNLSAMIDTYISHLQEFQACVDRADGEGLVRIMEQAKHSREQLS